MFNYPLPSNYCYDITIGAGVYSVCVHRRARLQIILSVRYTSLGPDVYLMHVIFPAIVVKALRLPKVRKTRVQLTSEAGCMFMLADFRNII